MSPAGGRGSPLRLEDLGVVILAYGSSDLHRDLLDDLLRSRVPAAQIVVSHNPDRPPDGWRPSLPRGGTLLADRYNLGYAAAMNRGIAACLARGDRAVLLLTHDVRVQAGTLDALLAAADHAPDFGVLGLAVAGARGEGAGASYGSFLGRDGVVVHVERRPEGEQVAQMPWVDGCALLLRPEALAAEPLPERYFLYFEEAELCAGVRERGWKAGVALDATASSVSGISQRRAAFDYLYVRNGLDWTRRRQGRRRAARFAAHEARRAWAALPLPGGRRFRDPALRKRGMELAAARALGLLDALRGRWGPPPPWLLRSSDVRNVAP